MRGGRERKKENDKNRLINYTWDEETAADGDTQGTHTHTHTHTEHSKMDDELFNIWLVFISGMFTLRPPAGDSAAFSDEMLLPTLSWVLSVLASELSERDLLLLSELSLLVVSNTFWRATLWSLF